MGGAVAGIDDPGYSKVITWDICRDHRSRLQLKNHIQFRRGTRFLYANEEERSAFAGGPRY